MNNNAVLTAVLAALGSGGSRKRPPRKKSIKSEEVQAELQSKAVAKRVRRQERNLRNRNESL